MKSLKGLVIVALVGFMGAAVVYYAGFWSADPTELDFDRDGPRLVALSALALVLGASLVFSRPHIGEVLRSVAIWGGLGIVLVAGYAMRHDLETIAWRTVGALAPGFAIDQPDGTIALVRDSSGHFTLKADVNGATVRFLVDTGASIVTLTQEDARAIGLSPDSLNYRTPVTTANGRALVATVRLDTVSIAGAELTGLRAFVAPPGKLETSLFGMNALDRFVSWRVEKGRMILRP